LPDGRCRNSLILVSHRASRCIQRQVESHR
jgi:hypothetical protein